MKSPNDGPVGMTLGGRYEVLAALGGGGTATVYEAVDRAGGARVAVKMLRADYLANDAMRRRLRREGAILKALDHPAIVRLLDVGVDAEGVVHLVTELVRGETLAERLARGPLPMPEADLLVTAVCGATMAAHAHGILHGDLKASNVIWPCAAGRSTMPRLVDFGASKVLGLDRLTATGELSGTPQYLAPEVLVGERELDGRIDVYALGVLLYEALSGTPPFRERHVGRLLMKIDAGDCLALDAVADVPPDIANVVSGAMKPRREERYSSMGDLEAAWHHARRP